MNQPKITPWLSALGFAAYMVLSGLPANAQTEDKGLPKDWYQRDETQDQLRGVSATRAYQELLAGKKPARKVIVAVLDSGVDVLHEDLKDVIWVNPKETAGNGVDDDKNGYVDDIHGWNFIGGKDGSHVNYDQLELTREYVRLKKLYAGKETGTFTEAEQAQYTQYLKIKAQYEKEVRDSEQNYGQTRGFIQTYHTIVNGLKEAMGTQELTQENVKAFSTTDTRLLRYKEVYLSIMADGITPEAIAEVEAQINQIFDYNLNPDFDGRSLVGDNYEDVTERYYGNNDVKGPDPTHGTHVAGIIAAARGNNLGMDGIAGNVQIMVVRTVPNGDERDKDVANAIRYAVDNGANIINMSFGKPLSPRKDIIDEAIAYAASKNVLLVHASGNDGKDIDIGANYPTRFLEKKEAPNWIEVGASAYDDEQFVADFSNYGKKAVQVFAPGRDIYSTLPESKYGDNSGTSMASPVVAGIAAVIMEYYPKLTAVQVKDIILKSAIKYTDRKVNQPGDEAGGQVAFGELSTTGGIANLYEALKLAGGKAK